VSQLGIFCKSINYSVSQSVIQLVSQSVS